MKKPYQRRHQYIAVSTIIATITMLPQIVLSFNFNHLLIMLFTLMLLIVTSLVSQKLFIILSIYVNLTNIVIVHIARHWGYAYADLSPRLKVIFESPKNEALGYISTYFDYTDFLNISYFIVIMWFLYRFSKHQKNLKKPIIRIGSFFILFLLVTTSFSYVKHREPYNIIPKILSISKGNDLIEKRGEFLNSLMKSTSSQKKLLYDKVIVVLGESVNKRHMGIYDYNKNTTPFLSTLKDNNSLYIFNAISPTNLTRFSVPILMTGAHVSDFSYAFSHSSSVLRDFGLNGYSTTWLSSQSIIGSRNDYIAACASDAGKSVFLNNFYDTWGKKDIEIINYLNIQKKPRKKAMYLLHLAGSHVKYSYRYEKEHSLFKEPKNIIEEYDNTIFYTDYILKNIFKTLINKDEKTLFIYISDHGELINQHKNGHGFSLPKKEEYEIPFVVYSTIKNDRIQTLFQLNKEHYFNLENFKPFISYVSGMSELPDVSTNPQVIAVDPKYIFNFDNLKYYQE